MLEPNAVIEPFSAGIAATTKRATLNKVCGRIAKFGPKNEKSSAVTD